MQVVCGSTQTSFIDSKRKKKGVDNKHLCQVKEEQRDKRPLPAPMMPTPKFKANKPVPDEMAANPASGSAGSDDGAATKLQRIMDRMASLRQFHGRLQGEQQRLEALLTLRENPPERMKLGEVLGTMRKVLQDIGKLEQMKAKVELLQTMPHDEEQDQKQQEAVGAPWRQQQQQQQAEAARHKQQQQEQAAEAARQMQQQEQMAAEQQKQQMAAEQYNQQQQNGS